MHSKKVITILQALAQSGLTFFLKQFALDSNTQIILSSVDIKKLLKASPV